MSKISINLTNVNKANSQIPGYLIVLESVKRELDLLKWRLDKEIMQQRDMSERYNRILLEIRKVEEELNDIHNVISSALIQYEQVENTLVNEFE